MFRNLALASLLLTANCARQDQPAPPVADEIVPTAAIPTPAARAAVPLLKGTWQVVGGAGLNATFSGGTAVLSEGCLRRAWRYSQRGNAVTFTTAPGGSSNCGRMPSAALDNAYGPLGDANMAVFSATGKTVTLSGLGGSLQLERR